MISNVAAYDFAPNTQVPGVSHALLIDACRVIAHNKDGYLSRDPSRTVTTARVREEETIVPASSRYYYFTNETSDTNTRYPVVSGFDDWAFRPVIPGR